MGPPSDPHLSSVLFDGFGVTPNPLTLEGSTWGSEIVDRIEHRHLACLAAAFVESRGVNVPVEIGRRIRRAGLGEAAGVASIVDRAGPILDALTADGIAFLVVKGVAVAGLYEPAAPRFMGDVDILVSPSDFQGAYECLARQGARTYSDNPRFGPDFCPSVNVTDDGGLQIDLHRAMAPWQWARGLSFERLNDKSRPVDVSGRSVSTTGTVHSLLVTAASIVSDCGTRFEKILPWRDSVLQMRAVREEGRIDELVDEAAATDTGWMLRLVLDALPEAVRPDDVIVRLPSPTPLQRARMAAAHDARLAQWQWSFIFFRWPLRRVVAFERGMFWPTRASLRSRGYVSRVTFVKELVEELRSN